MANPSSRPSISGTMESATDQRNVLTMYGLVNQRADLLSLDPKSLTMLAYMSLVRDEYNESFTYKTVEGDLRNLPNVRFEGRILYSIEDLSTTKLSLEKYRGIPPRKEISEIRTAINTIEDVCIFCLKSLKPNDTTWNPRDRNAVSADELTERMESSCKFLCELLECNAYVLDKLYGKESYPSYLDAQLFGAAIVIYKRFGCSGELNSHCSTVYQILKGHLILWAYLERQFSQYIERLSYKPLNWSSELVKDQNFLTRWILRKKNVLKAPGKTYKNMYSYSCSDINPLGLDGGDYIVKHAPDLRGHDIETEILMHQQLLHKSFIRLEGYGLRSFQDIDWDDAKNYVAEGFLVYPRKKKGSLEHNLKDLEWPMALKISREIAYSMHLVHISNLVLCDLKPDNILLEDDSSPLMIDFGSITRRFDKCGNTTLGYNDGTTGSTYPFIL